MSSERMFVVAVDIFDPAVELSRVTEMLKTNAAIKGWWNHIPGCFLISTDLAADQLAEQFKAAANNARLLVMAVDPSTSEGWLPERSWKWIRRYEVEDVR